MDAGIAYAKEYNLKPGIALTKEQIAALTSATRRQITLP